MAPTKLVLVLFSIHLKRLSHDGSPSQAFLRRPLSGLVYGVSSSSSHSSTSLPLMCMLFTITSCPFSPINSSPPHPTLSSSCSLLWSPLNHLMTRTDKVTTVSTECNSFARCADKSQSLIKSVSHTHLKISLPFITVIN